MEAANEKTGREAMTDEGAIVFFGLIISIGFIVIGVREAGLVGNGFSAHPANFTHGLVAIGIGVFLLVFLRLAYVFGSGRAPTGSDR